MTDFARQMLRARRAPLHLVIFDCDGVLVDSEPVTNRVVAAELTRLGWPMNAAGCQVRFLGMNLSAMVPLIEAKLGRPLPARWPHDLEERLVTVLGEDVELMPGAEAALAETTRLGLPWRIASNSSHAELRAKFGRNGLGDLVAGRLHSHHDVRLGKPAPDLFLAAASAEGVAPENCLVIEDSLPGVRAAMAAGMTCLGFCPDDDGARLMAAGAAPFHSLHDLPMLLRLALEGSE
ncbi:MAG TPA: HAD-IA family hydrolase [Acetobacteraceae bacterium]|jgi:HAD superfamily hydrolase (TIGR01509 family)|nr:HAD-IA family hydrolase [Acetobacteraceae bacterium]